MGNNRACLKLVTNDENGDNGRVIDLELSNATEQERLAIIGGLFGIYGVGAEIQQLLELHNRLGKTYQEFFAQVDGKEFHEGAPFKPLRFHDGYGRPADMTERERQLREKQERELAIQKHGVRRAPEHIDDSQKADPETMAAILELYDERSAKEFAATMQGAIGALQEECPHNAEPYTRQSAARGRTVHCSACHAELADEKPWPERDDEPAATGCLVCGDDSHEYHPNGEIDRQRRAYTLTPRMSPDTIDAIIRASEVAAKQYSDITPASGATKGLLLGTKKDDAGTEKGGALRNHPSSVRERATLDVLGSTGHDGSASTAIGELPAGEKLLALKAALEGRSTPSNDAATEAVRQQPTKHALQEPTEGDAKAVNLRAQAREAYAAKQQEPATYPAKFRADTWRPTPGYDDHTTRESVHEPGQTLYQAYYWCQEPTCGHKGRRYVDPRKDHLHCHECGTEHALRPATEYINPENGMPVRDVYGNFFRADEMREKTAE